LRAVCGKLLERPPLLGCCLAGECGGGPVGASVACPGRFNCASSAHRSQLAVAVLASGAHFGAHLWPVGLSLSWTLGSVGEWPLPYPSGWEAESGILPSFGSLGAKNGPFWWAAGETVCGAIAVPLHCRESVPEDTLQKVCASGRPFEGIILTAILTARAEAPFRPACFPLQTRIRDNLQRQLSMADASVTGSPNGIVRRTK